MSKTKQPFSPSGQNGKPTTKELELMLVGMYFDADPEAGTGTADYIEHLLHRITARHYNQGLGDALGFKNGVVDEKRDKRIAENRRWGDL